MPIALTVCKAETATTTTAQWASGENKIEIEVTCHVNTTVRIQNKRVKKTNAPYFYVSRFIPNGFESTNGKLVIA